jgi:hypothetical protein
MKLQRAEEHLGQLRSEHDRFIKERNPYRMIREADPEPGFYVWRVKIVEQAPLEKWSSLVGEFAHALRSALDHTAYELVRINKPAFEFSEFPIFKHPGKWKDGHASKLPGVETDVLTVVEGLQPYHGDGELDALWLVHQLDIIDKHRRLNLVSSALAATGWAVNGGAVDHIEPNYGPFEDGTPVMRFRLVPDSPGAPMHVQTNFAFDIAFGEGELLAGNSVQFFLEGMLVEIAGTVSVFDLFFS